MIEVPAYTVIARNGVAEIRRYEPYVIASVRSTGGELKGGDGFRMLARYIGAFGTPENEGASGKPESIKMTAPVVTGAEESDSYWMSFIVPKTWSLDTLPRPRDERVVLKDVPERVVASHYFSGNCTDESVSRKEEALRGALPIASDQDGARKWVVKEGARRELARYNDPFTPWFLRTNEIWLEVEAVDAAS